MKKTKIHNAYNNALRLQSDIIRDIRTYLHNEVNKGNMMPYDMYNLPIILNGVTIYVTCLKIVGLDESEEGIVHIFYTRKKGDNIRKADYIRMDILPLDELIKIAKNF